MEILVANSHKNFIIILNILFSKEKRHWIYTSTRINERCKEATNLHPQKVVSFI